MRLSCLLSICFVFLLTSLNGQSSRRTTTAINLAPSAQPMLVEGSLPFPDVQPFFSYFLVWPSGELQARIRFSEDGLQWQAWEVLEHDEHGTENGATSLRFGEAEWRFYQLELSSTSGMEIPATLHFYTPGLAEEAGTNTTTEYEGDSRDLNACPCPQPEYQDRDDWCPGGNCPRRSVPSPTTVTHLIVHHSAGANSSSNWAATVRSIWDFHYNGRGWDDIGYNWLIDPNGVVYEGRGDDVQGAHFSGRNGGTMGVCVLGNFTDRLPNGAALSALYRMLAWKSCDRGIDPEGISLHASSELTIDNISGHRDGPVFTECPGETFHPTLPAVRTIVADLIETGCLQSGPVTLRSEPVGALSFQFDWTYTGMAEVDSFDLERSIDSNDDYQPYLRFAGNTTSYEEMELEANRFYYYRMRAFTTIPDTTAFGNAVIINTGLVNTNDYELPSSMLQLSPNPTNGPLQLKLNNELVGELHWQLLDAQQRNLRHWHDHKTLINWQGQLDLQGLPAGMYYLHLELGGKRGVWQVVKE